MQLPNTTTAVSFSLRRAYMTFLWDFEQVSPELGVMVCGHGESGAGEA
jgi:hypothetical protein